MSMISLNGELLHVFKAPKREDQDEKDKIQILGDVVLKNGETRKDLITITVKDARKFEDLVGTMVNVPVGVFAPQKGTVIFFQQGA